MSGELNFRYKIKPITTLRYDDMVDEVKNKVIKQNNILFIVHFFCVVLLGG